MKREFIAVLGGGLIVMAGLSGCSSDGEAEGSATETGTAAQTGTATAAPSGSGDTRVTIDGQDQDVQGTVVCSAAGGNMNIAIGEATTGIAVVVSDGESPAVQSVGLGNVNNVTLGYQSGTGQGEASAQKDGNTYKISGTASGVDMANPMQPVTKPFEIEVACP